MNERDRAHSEALEYFRLTMQKMRADSEELMNSPDEYQRLKGEAMLNFGIPKFEWVAKVIADIDKLTNSKARDEAGRDMLEAMIQMDAFVYGCAIHVACSNSIEEAALTVNMLKALASYTFDCLKATDGPTKGHVN